MYNFIIKQKFFVKNLAQKIISSFFSKKINPFKLYLFFVFALVIFVFSTNFTFAEEALSSIVGYIMETFSWVLLALAQFFIALTVFFLRFFITLASYNDYIDTGVVKIGWYMVRDVANMFFIVALLVIAFATILGIEKYEWKKSMVKLVIMAILINFSNMIAQLIIDVAHVFTITFLNAISATAGGNLISMFSLDKVLEMVGKKDLGWTNEMQMQTQVFAAAAAGLIFAILAAAAIGSYCLIMVYRVVILWALIILSPLAFLFSAMPATEKYAQEWWKEFINYVTVAPIMVFFLWLAFASLGAGDIMAQIQGNSGAVIALGSDGGEIQSASLAEVTEWTKMANFIIALVFLMVGVRKTKETGVEGANTIDKAMDFGKKVATVATGYAAGRWMVDKGMSGAKALGVMTGKKILAKSGVADIGAELLNKYRIKRDINKEKRAQQVKNWEADYKDNKTIGNWFKSKMVGQLWQPEERSQKVRSDWKRAAELANETMMDNLGTSGTRAGDMKQKQGSRLANQKLLGEGKKVEKELKLFMKLQDEFKKGAGNEHQENLKALDSKDETKIKEAKIKYEDALKNISLEAKETFAHGDVGGKRDNAFKAKAAVEKMKKEESRLTDLSIAKKRDEELIRNGQPPRYTEQVMTRHRKEDQEEFEGLNFAQMRGMAQNLKGAKDIKPDEIKTRAALLSTASSRDSETQGAVIEKLLENSKFKENIDQSDLLGTHRKFLSAILGRNIEKNGKDEAGNVISEKDQVSNAYKELETKLGSEVYNSMIKNLDTSFKEASKDGGIDLVGFFDDSEINEKGQIEFKPVFDQKYFEDKKDYFAKRTNVKQITDLDGAGNKYKKSDGKTAFTIYKDVGGKKKVDVRALNQIVQILSSVKGNTTLNGAFVDYLNELAKDKDSGIDEVMEVLKKNYKTAYKSITEQVNSLKKL